MNINKSGLYMLAAMNLFVGLYILSMLVALKGYEAGLSWLTAGAVLVMAGSAVGIAVSFDKVHDKL